MKKQPVYFRGTYCGNLYFSTEGYLFQYENEYVRMGGPAIDPHLPPRSNPYMSMVLFPAFENLLPEGTSLRKLAESLQVAQTDYLALLAGATQDGQGAIRVSDASEISLNTFLDAEHCEAYAGAAFGKCHGSYETAQEFYAPAFAKQAGIDTGLYLPYRGREFEWIIDEANKSGTTMSGMQPKISGSALRNIAQGRYLGRHIIKFTSPGFAHTPEVEHLTMKLAQTFGIETCQNFLIRCSDGTAAYVAKRFDRDQDGAPYPMVDFCQLTNVNSDKKYDDDYCNLVGIIEQYSVTPGRDKREFFRQVLFSYGSGNNDLHKKNLAMLDAGQGYRLSPAYDLVSVSTWNQGMNFWEDVMRINNRAEPRYRDIMELGQLCGMTDRQVHREAEYLVATFKKFDDIVERSFLNDSMKAAFRTNVRKNMVFIENGLAQELDKRHHQRKQ